MSGCGGYREPVHFDSDDSIELEIARAANAVTPPPSHSNMNVDQFKAAMETVLATALAAQSAQFQRQEEALRSEFKEQLDSLTGRLKATHLAIPEVEVYKDVEVVDGITCDEPLNVVKSLSDFHGTQDSYVSWRQSALAAYKIYRRYNGSSRHYQAVLIIRQKCKAAADSVLASFNTPLNVDAIISRLDFTYSDKRPIHVIEQEMGTLRQGTLSILEYYDEVEKKLTLLTNKVNMSYESGLAKGMCEKFRADALRVFISGLKRNLTDVLFASHPPDLPSALDLAQELEANHDRYAFAASFAKGQEERANRSGQRSQGRESGQDGQRGNGQMNRNKNPIYKQQGGQKQTQNEISQARAKEDNQPVPMEVDASTSRFRQSTAYQGPQGSGRQNNYNGNGGKRPANSDRVSGQRRQRLDNIATQDDKAQADYNSAVCEQ